MIISGLKLAFFTRSPESHNFVTFICYPSNMTKLSLFEHAALNIAMSADCEEMLESGQSILLEALLRKGFPEEDAQMVVLQNGTTASSVADAMLNCFEVFGCADEFEEWSNQDEVIEKSVDSLEYVAEQMLEYDEPAALVA